MTCFFLTQHLFVFIFGTVVGSFLNVVILRLPKKEKFTTNRSYCPHCKHKLGPLDLVPILSFLFLKGRCRYCRKKISIQYLLVELTTGTLFVLAFILINNLVAQTSSQIFLPLYFLYLLFILSGLIAIFVIDLKFLIIPNRILLPLTLVSLVCGPLWSFLGFKQNVLRIDSLFFEAQYVLKSLLHQDYSNYIFISPLPSFLTPILTGILSFGFMLLIHLFSHGKGMGMGDVKFALFMGVFLGWPETLWAYYLAFGSGAMISLFLMLLKQKGLKDKIPFGPFLVLGTILAFFVGFWRSN